MRIRIVVPALLGAGLLLSGCAAAAPHSDPTRARTPSASPTTPAPTPSASEDPADPTTWIISADGVGPASLGGTRDSVVTALSPLGTPLEPGCPNDAITFIGPPGSSLASSDTVVIATSGDTGVVAIALGVTGPRTESGIGIGSTLSEVTAAYPAAEHATRNQAVDEYVVQGDPGWITFQMSADDGSATVDLISVVKGSEPPAEYCG